MGPRWYEGTRILQGKAAGGGGGAGEAGDSEELRGWGPHHEGSVCLQVLRPLPAHSREWKAVLEQGQGVVR